MDKRKFIKQISSYFAAASFSGFLVSCAGVIKLKIIFLR